ncbi:MAG: NADP-dependent phosphogluconate dehydrogenase, partial [Pyrinomonadaceae bacterium]
VHNGIEYGLMQLISETYDYMRRVMGSTAYEAGMVFAEWNGAELNSFLIEITAAVIVKKDEHTGNPLVEMILDTAGQKGTGKWTSQSAMDFGVPIPTIDSAVTMRQISSRKTLRGLVSARYESETGIRSDVGVDDLKKALIFSFIVTYAQGLTLLSAASGEKNYDLNVAEIAKIWRGGCIIRAALLENIRAAYVSDPALQTLMLDGSHAAVLDNSVSSARKALSSFVQNGLPTMCLSSAVAYFDAFRSERLPANLLQAQRDFFGAHTYQRTDMEGTFHTSDWDKH